MEPSAPYLHLVGSRMDGLQDRVDPLAVIVLGGGAALLQIVGEVGTRVPHLPSLLPDDEAVYGQTKEESQPTRPRDQQRPAVMVGSKTQQDGGTDGTQEPDLGLSLMVSHAAFLIKSVLIGIESGRCGAADRGR